MATFETTGIKKHETEKAVLYAIPHFHCKNPDDKMDVEVWIPKSLIYKAATHFTGKFDIIRVDAKLLNQKIHKPMIGIYSAGYWQPIGVAE